MSDLHGIGQILGYVGPAGALGIVMAWMFIRSQREERQAERESRAESERRRTTDIEQIVKGWEKSSDAMLKVCDETRQAVLQVHASIRETSAQVAQAHQSNKHDHELLRDSMRDLVTEQRMRAAGATRRADTES